MIADYSGESHERIHEFLKAQFNRQSITVANKETGESIDSEISGSTTELTTVEFMEYIENVLRWAAEFLSLVIPEPNQTEWIEWRSMRTAAHSHNES